MVHSLWRNQELSEVRRLGFLGGCPIPAWATRGHRRMAVLMGRSSRGTGGVNGARHTGVTVVADAVGQIHDLLLFAVQREPGRHFTLHVNFTADDPRRAREVAMALAEGSGILRPEVATYSAAVSTGGAWGDAEPVFCMAGGPEGAF